MKSWKCLGLLHNTQFNDDWINDTSEIVNNVDRCAVVNEAMIVSNLLHNAQFNDDWTNDTSEIVNNVDRCAMANEAIGLSRSMLSYYIEMIIQWWLDRGSPLK